MIKEKIKAIWCDHCNAEISLAGVRGCVRKDCQSKGKLPGALLKAQERKPYGRR